MAMTPSGATGRIGNFWDDSMFSFMLEYPFIMSMRFSRLTVLNSLIITHFASNFRTNLLSL